MFLELKKAFDNSVIFSSKEQPTHWSVKFDSRGILEVFKLNRVCIRPQQDLVPNLFQNPDLDPARFATVV